MPKPPKNVDVSKLTLKYRLDYEEIAQSVRDGKHVFIEDLKSRQAYYACRRLCAILHRDDLKLIPAYLNTGEQGYYVQVPTQTEGTSQKS